MEYWSTSFSLPKCFNIFEILIMKPQSKRSYLLNETLYCLLQLYILLYLPILHIARSLKHRFNKLKIFYLLWFNSSLREEVLQLPTFRNFDHSNSIIRVFTSQDHMSITSCTPLLMQRLEPILKQHRIFDLFKTAIHVFSIKENMIQRTMNYLLTATQFFFQRHPPRKYVIRVFFPIKTPSQ